MSDVQFEEKLYNDRGYSIFKIHEKFKDPINYKETASSTKAVRDLSTLPTKLRQTDNNRLFFGTRRF